ncbi:hypothetical protein [Castellaniella sp.]|uniref:hypothetical protein n=1 Tax=Castellaniella sp. TaxID=1955812 RepID=UPI002B003CFA|nr:hypothetical protein [Castellaniella sp.]
MIAQSLGAPGSLGGYGDGSFAGAVHSFTSGSTEEPLNYSTGVSLELNGTVQVQGQNSWGVFAQSYGAQRVGNTLPPVGISVSGVVSGGQTLAGQSPTGGAIWIDSISRVPGGLTNLVIIQPGGKVSGQAGLAGIQYTGDGFTRISNQGELDGNLLGPTASSTALSLSNQGSFSGATQVHGHIFSQGQVTVGAGLARDTLRVMGDYIQDSQGWLNIGTDFVPGAADQLQVEGRASLQGRVRVLASSLVPTRELGFLQAHELSSDLTAQGRSDLFTYRVHQSGSSLGLSVDQARFRQMTSVYGLGQNLGAVRQHLQDI